MITKKKIEEIKQKIIKTVFPEKIILFGSYATGRPTEESDIDLVVIWNSDLNPHKRSLFKQAFPKKRLFTGCFCLQRKRLKSSRMLQEQLYMKLSTMAR